MRGRGGAGSSRGRHPREARLWSSSHRVMLLGVGVHTCTCVCAVHMCTIRLRVVDAWVVHVAVVALPFHGWVDACCAVL